MCRSGTFATISATPDCSCVISSMGRSLARTLGHNAAVLMRGHGCAVTGRTVRDAVRIAVYLMVNARLQTEAMRLGDVTFLSEGEITRDDRDVGDRRLPWIASGNIGPVGVGTLPKPFRARNPKGPDGRACIGTFGHGTCVDHSAWRDRIVFRQSA